MQEALQLSAAGNLGKSYVKIEGRCVQRGRAAIDGNMGGGGRVGELRRGGRGATIIDKRREFKNGAELNSGAVREAPPGRRSALSERPACFLRRSFEPP